MTWNPNSLVEDSLGVDGVKVDITLHRYTDQDEWEETPLVTDLPNSGCTSLTIPELPGLSESNSADPALIQVRVNASRTIQSSRSKRIPIVALPILWKFTKLAAIYYVKSSIKRRLACEAWHLADPGVNTRRLPPCPCNTSQASGDNRFINETGFFPEIFQKYIFHRGSGICYRQRDAR